MINKYSPWILDDLDPQFLPNLQPPYPDNFIEYKQYIIDNVLFVKVLQHYKLRFEESGTGKYTHKMICPFRFHKGGKERTGSFRFNAQTNIFMCYGCSSGGDIIKFMYHYAGKLDDETILRRLAIIGGLIKDGYLYVPEHYIEIEPEQQKETNKRILFDIGISLRQHLIGASNLDNYIDEREWVDRIMIKIDKYFGTLDEENIEDAKKIQMKIVEMIKGRL